MIRDIILGNMPPCALMYPRNLTVALLSAWLYSYGAADALAVIVYSDASWARAFTTLGVLLACYLPEHTSFLAAMTGLFTGVGVGVACCATSCRRDPFVLRKQVYATASVIGAVAYYLTHARFLRCSLGYYDISWKGMKRARGQKTSPSLGLGGTWRGSI